MQGGPRKRDRVIQRGTGHAGRNASGGIVRPPDLALDEIRAVHERLFTARARRR